MKIRNRQGEKKNVKRGTLLQWTKEKGELDDLMIAIFTDEEQLENLATYWKDLEDRADCPIYVSYEWASNWWKYFGKNEQRTLFLVTVWDGTKIVGLAPFYKEYSPYSDVLWGTRVQLMGRGDNIDKQGSLDDYGISHFLDIIVDRNYLELVADKLSDFFSKEFLNADTLAFHQVTDDSFIITYLYPRLQDLVPDLKLEQTDKRHFIDLSADQSISSYINSLKMKEERPPDKQTYSIPSVKEYDIEDVTVSWEQVEASVQNIIEFHQTNWNGRRGPDFLYDSRFTMFFKDTIKYSYDNGWLWFKEAVGRQGVCASCIAFKYNNCHYILISGYDEDRPSNTCSPNIGLMKTLIEDGIADTVEGIELLRSARNTEFKFIARDIKNWKLTLPISEKKERMDTTTRKRYAASR